MVFQEYRQFQSRNRETFDSNSPLSEPLRGLL